MPRSHRHQLSICMGLFVAGQGCEDVASVEDGTGASSGADVMADGSSTGDQEEVPLHFTVTVNGVEVPVQRLDRFETPVSFVRFDHVPDALIEVTTNVPYERYRLSPERLGIESTLEPAGEGNKVSFTLAEPEYLIFYPREQDERLLILADPPEESPPQPGTEGVVDIMDFEVDDTGATLMTDVIQRAIDEVGGTGQTLYFPPGTYLTGELWLRDSMTLYLADGAVLKGSSELGDIVTENPEGSTIEQCLHALIRMYGVTDSHIRGRGIIDGNGVFHRDKERPETKYNLLKIEESSDCSVDGVIALDSSFWSTIIYRSDAIDIRNYKVINNYLSVGYNETDGVDFDNATNGTLTNALLYVGDDCMATKSDDIPDDYEPPPDVENYPADPTTAEYIATSNIVHQDVVCFTNQAAAKVGTKTMGTEMSEISFRGIDVAKCGRGMVIDNMDTALVHDIVFEDLVFEYLAPFDLVHFIVRRGTPWRASEGTGTIEGVTASDIVVQDLTLPPMFRIEGRTDEASGTIYPVRDITFTGVAVDGERITEENREDLARFVLHEAEAITFE